MSLDDRPIKAPSYRSLPPAEQQQRLKELAAVFLKLGTIAFGGPAAHVAMMDDEVVKRRQWFTHDNLMDLFGITNLLPGPNSTELAIHIGYERAGWRGLFVAGSCFILPAMLIVWALAALYMRSQTIPQVEWLLYGVKPVIIAIVLQALWKLGRAAIKDYWTAIAAAAVIALYFFDVNELLLLLAAGVLVMLAQQARRIAAAGLLPLAIATATQPAAPTAEANWVSLFLIFLKIGSILYGSGYVLLAFLQREFVERTQWLTSQQLLDAIAIGQVTPGPVFTTATFVGYLLAGHAGAIAATVGIFLPAFVLVGIVNPWVPKLRRSRWLSSFLNGVNAASLGLMAAVTWELGRAALIDWPTVAVAILSAIGVFRRINSAWLVLAGAIVGLTAKGLNLI